MTAKNLDAVRFAQRLTGNLIIRSNRMHDSIYTQFLDAIQSADLEVRMPADFIQLRNQIIAAHEKQEITLESASDLFRKLRQKLRNDSPNFSEF